MILVITECLIFMLMLMKINVESADLLYKMHLGTMYFPKSLLLTSDGMQNFKNRFSFVSNSLTTGSLILDSLFAVVV